MQVDPRKLRRDGGTQSRVVTNLEHVERLRGQIRLPHDLTGGRDGTDPILAYKEGNTYWLAHGFHRTAAYIEERHRQIWVVVRDGTLRDAVLYSASCNREPSLARSNDDIERAVCILLEDAEWAAWANVRIARHCGVNEKTVRNWRIRLEQRRREEKQRERERLAREKAAANGEGVGSSDCESDPAEEDDSPVPEQPAPQAPVIQEPAGMDDAVRAERLLNTVFPAQRPVDEAYDLKKAEDMGVRHTRKSIRHAANLGLTVAQYHRRFILAAVAGLTEKEKEGIL